MADAPLSCREITELATAYLERKMPRDQQLAFARHMRACPICFTYLRQLRVASRALARAPAPKPAPATRDALLAHFRNWDPQRKKG
mgnify:FL=1